MIKVAVPLLHVSNAAAALAFYCDKLGFKLQFQHRPPGIANDPCYVGVSRDAVWINLSSFSGDGVAGGVVNLMVDDVDKLHQEFVAKGIRTFSRTRRMPFIPKTGSSR